MTGDGIDDVLARLGAAREGGRGRRARAPAVRRPPPGRPRFSVPARGDRFRVVGRGVERWVTEADLEDAHDLERLQRRLVKDGVERKLASEGARRGDEVQILDRVFEFLPDPAPEPDLAAARRRRPALLPPRRPDPMDVERLIGEESASWDRLLEVFASIPDDRFEEPTVTPEGWSPKDVMFHVAYWTADCADVLERMSAGTWDGGADETTGTIEASNRDGFERSTAMPPAEVRAGFAEGRARMLGAFRALDEVTPGAWEWFEESGPLHYAKHVDDLAAWLGR